MEKKTTEGVCESSRIYWEGLEGLAREQIQRWLQGVLEEEVTEFLGRGKGERHRWKMDRPAGYRNGHGKPRRVSMSSGTIAVRRPRMRGMSERFVSRILPLFC
jgi:transposase-like protein